MILLSHFLEKSWVDDLEGMGQGQKLLYNAYILLVVNTCARYEQDPFSGREVMEQT